MQFVFFMLAFGVFITPEFLLAPFPAVTPVWVTPVLALCVLSQVSHVLFLLLIPAELVFITTSLFSLLITLPYLHLHH